MTARRRRATRFEDRPRNGTDLARDRSVPDELQLRRTAYSRHRAWLVTRPGALPGSTGEAAACHRPACLGGQAKRSLANGLRF